MNLYQVNAFEVVLCYTCTCKWTYIVHHIQGNAFEVVLRYGNWVLEM